MDIRFIDETDIIDIHEVVIENSPFKEDIGFAPDTSLESALHRVYNHITYNGEEDLYVLAALYGISICKGHVFLAGNKRTAMVTMGNFLLLNGIELTASQADVEQVMVDIAEDRITHEELVEWLRRNTITGDLN